MSSLPLLLAEDVPAGPQSLLSSPMIPMLLIFGVIYFLLLRPMSKQEKDRKARVTALKKGDQVVLSGGLMGRISNWDDPQIATVEIADKVKVRVLKKEILDARDAVLEKDKEKDKGKDKARDTSKAAEAG